MHANRVGAGGRTKRDAAEVAEECNRAVRLGRRAEELARGDVLETIGEEVGVGVAEDERAELGDRDEAVGGGV